MPVSKKKVAAPKSKAVKETKVKVVKGYKTLDDNVDGKGLMLVSWTFKNDDGENVHMIGLSYAKALLKVDTHNALVAAEAPEVKGQNPWSYKFACKSQFSKPAALRMMHLFGNKAARDKFSEFAGVPVKKTSK